VNVTKLWKFSSQYYLQSRLVRQNEEIYFATVDGNLFIYLHENTAASYYYHRAIYYQMRRIQEMHN